MLECLIIGDSIAVGTHQVRQECVSYSKGGWNTWQWNKQFIDKDRKDLTAQTVIISLGTNDHNGVKTFDELLKMRRNVQAARVFWIMPPCNDKFCKPHVNEIVKLIAKNFGDTVISTKRLQPDAIHPSWAGYKELAEQSKK
jgi:lysophospholipase L1-like esterase